MLDIYGYIVYPGKTQLENFVRLQGGQDFFAYTLKKDLTLKLTRPSKAKKELFVEQILLSDLRLDTFELKNTKSDQSVYHFLK